MAQVDLFVYACCGSLRLRLIRQPINYSSNHTMLYALGALLLIALIYGPSLWVRYILRKYSTTLDGMPGTGGELALHLKEQFKLDELVVEQAGDGENYYSPLENAVRLEPSVFNGKSLTAVATAAHEIGHAIQFTRNEPVSHLRSRYMPIALRLQKAGTLLLFALPIVGLVTKSPHIAGLTLLIGIGTMLVSVAMYAAILPEEYDASFNKALPILKKGQYIPEAYLPAVNTILKACAYTYVAAALTNVFSLWRWLRFLR